MYSEFSLTNYWHEVGMLKVLEADCNTGFYGDKILYKVLILPKIFPTRFCFTFYGNKILYKIFPRFLDGRKCALLANF